MIVIDATLSAEALATVFEIADRYHTRASAPTRPCLSLAGRLIPLSVAACTWSRPTPPRRPRSAALPDPARPAKAAIDAARHLVSMGVEIAVVTLGEQGVAYADGSGGGFIRAMRTQVVDPTGAGDAFSAAVIFGLLNEVPVDEAMRLGMTAAALTLQSRETVLPGLSQELLYDKLVV